MTTTDTKDAIKEAAVLIEASRSLLAFTGAGVSAESGMPTFRGPGGIYGSYDEQHLELWFFIHDPGTAWKTIQAIFFEFTIDYPAKRRPPHSGSLGALGQTVP